MTILESTEQWESQWLSPYASLSRNSRGREKEEPECDIRPVYQRDRDRILHCKSFRRLKHKTQVFLTPQGDHYRTRLTHTLEVAQTARTIARALRLNEDLTEAIALGHDLGHTPFGHAGERALNQVCSEGFAHHQQSVRIVERLEKGGKGSITEQLLNARADVTLGGGAKTFAETATAGEWQGKTLREQAQARGYQLVSDTASLNSVTEANQQKPLLGLFADGNMPVRWQGPKATYHGNIDKPAVTCTPNPQRNDSVPTLAQMTD